MSSLSPTIAVVIVVFVIFGHNTDASRALLKSSNQSQYIESIVTFGDSLVDTGLPFGLWSLNNKSWPYESMGYNAGRHTNKLMWTEYAAKSAHLKLVNFGQGGATVNNISDSMGLGLLGNELNMMNQLKTFDQYMNKVKKKNINLAKSLAIIVVGSNDFLSLAPDASKDITGTMKYLGNISSGIGAFALTLIQKGFHAIMIATVPPIDIAPASKGLEKSSIGSLQFAQNLVNQGINKTVNALAAAHNTTLIRLLDTYGFVKGVVADPASWSIKNFTDPCLLRTPDGWTKISVCSNPDDYMFWDSLHPGSGGNMAMAKWFKAILKKNELIK